MKKEKCKWETGKSSGRKGEFWLSRRFELFWQPRAFSGVSPAEGVCPTTSAQKPSRILWRQTWVMQWPGPVWLEVGTRPSGCKQLVTSRETQFSVGTSACRVFDIARFLGHQTDDVARPEGIALAWLAGLGPSGHCVQRVVMAWSKTRHSWVRGEV